MLPDPFDAATRRTLRQLVLVGLAQGACVVAGALAVRAVVHRVGLSPPAALATLGMLLLALATSGVLLAALRWWERVQAEALGQTYAARVRLHVFDALARQPQRATARSHGALLMRVAGDSAALRRWLSRALPRLLVGGLTVGLALLTLAVWLPPVGAVAMTTYALTAVVLAIRARRAAPAVRAARRRQGILAAELGDRLGALATVHLFGQVERERRRLDRRQQAMVRAMVGQRRTLAGLAACSQGGAAVTAALSLAAGAWWVGLGHATVADLVGAASLLAFAGPSVGGLGRVAADRQAARVAHERLTALLVATRDAAPLPPDKDAAFAERQVSRPGAAVALSLQSVSVRGVLADVTASVPPGARVAIVGANGAGKSSLLAVVCGLARPDAGEVLLDEVPVDSLSPAERRRRIGVVSPDVPLLRGTLGRNLGYACPRASARRRERVETLCGVDELLRQLPQGVATRLEGSARNLSWGQRQRIAWARALLSGPGLLLLDEPDAHLDTASAGHLDQVLQRFPGTVLMVTHDLHRLRTADEVWVLEGGRLVERGAPDSLLAGPTRTRALFARQLRGAA
ncbi:MAG: ABC transporter ATP-binding protein [Rhodoferax sp.]|nr:ABC transporter ATP-binding protein [Rhodoferax sp.]